MIVDLNNVRYTIYCSLVSDYHNPMSKAPALGLFCLRTLD